MAEIQIVDDGDCERGKRGRRGHRGDDGADGPTGPTGATGATGPVGLPQIIAAANVAAGGTFFGTVTGFSAIAHPGLGVYVLTLTSPPADPDNLLVVALIRTSVDTGQISYDFTSPDVTIRTADPTGAAADQDFSVLAYSQEP
jgi:hypothetical protein